MVAAVGVVGLVVLVVATVVAHGWRRSGSAEPLWDLPRVGGNYTGIVGSLAGFSVASATFLAAQAAARGAERFELVIAMFLAAFLILISCAMGFASLATTTSEGPRSTTLRALQQDVTLLAICGLVLGLSVAWFALRPLLLAIGLVVAADAFTWLLLIGVVGGGARVTLALRRLHGTRRATRLVLLGLAIGGPIAYRLLSFAVPSLWPQRAATLDFTVAAFLVAAVCFGLQTFLESEYDQPIIERWIAVEHRVVLGLAATTVTLVTLLWLAVATAA
jgi:hypothetical protein